MAVHGFPPMLMGALRFLIAGMLMLGWCAAKGDRVWVLKNVITSGISGSLMLFIATGIIICVEKTLPSSITAIVVCASPVWFILFDKANWKVNFRNKTAIAGIILGFAGVLLLFGEAFIRSFTTNIDHVRLTGLLLLLLSSMAWSAGSLFSKKRGGSGPARLNAAYQMIIAGLAFFLASFFNHEYSEFHFGSVPMSAWMALGYLVVFGSIGAFSAYVWLLSVKPATQVSTHSYVNPVIAVLLGVLFAHESISPLQLLGLAVILVSLLLINFTKYAFRLPKISAPVTFKKKNHKPLTNNELAVNAFKLNINKSTCI
jgi:drug/metabolite transporter (DMT)-like permease